MKKINSNRRGFSLFELLVTISIIGILMAVAMVSYSSAQKKARDNRRVQDMNAIQKAAEQRYATNSYVYPQSTALSEWRTATGEQIMEVFPTDPKNSGSYIYNYDGTFASGTGYCACALLEDTQNKGNATSTNCTFGAGNYFCVRNQQ